MNNYNEARQYLNKALDSLALISDGSQGFKEIQAISNLMIVVIDLIEFKNYRAAMTSLENIVKQLGKVDNAAYSQSILSIIEHIRKIWKQYTNLTCNNTSSDLILTDIKFDSKLLLKVQNMKEFKSTSIEEKHSDDILYKPRFEKLLIEKCLIPYAKPVAKSISSEELKMISMSKYIFDSRVIDQLMDIETQTNNLYKN